MLPCQSKESDKTQQEFPFIANHGVFSRESGPVFSIVLCLIRISKRQTSYISCQVPFFDYQEIKTYGWGGVPVQVKQLQKLGS